MKNLKNGIKRWLNRLKEKFLSWLRKVGIMDKQYYYQEYYATDIESGESLMLPIIFVVSDWHNLRRCKKAFVDAIYKDYDLDQVLPVKQISLEEARSNDAYKQQYKSESQEKVKGVPEIIWVNLPRNGNVFSIDTFEVVANLLFEEEILDVITPVDFTYKKKLNCLAIGSSVTTAQELSPQRKFPELRIFSRLETKVGQKKH